jgi:hypothetical protein
MTQIKATHSEQPDDQVPYLCYYGKILIEASSIICSSVRNPERPPVSSILMLSELCDLQGFMPCSKIWVSLVSLALSWSRCFSTILLGTA